MARKTVNVEYIRNMINERLLKVDDLSARKELCAILENVLVQADRYDGFRYVGGWNGTETYRHHYY